MSTFKGNPSSKVQIKPSNSKPAHSFSLILLDDNTVSQGEREGEGLDVWKN